MSTVKVSPKYQVVIPKDVREQLKLRPGQRLMVMALGDTITLVPDRPLRDFVGIFKGMDTSNIREKQDREI